MAWNESAEPIQDNLEVSTYKKDKAHHTTYIQHTLAYHTIAQVALADKKWWWLYNFI